MRQTGLKLSIHPSGVLVLLTVLILGACSGDADGRADGDGTGSEAPQSGPVESVVASASEVESLTRDVDLAIALAYVRRRFGDVDDLEWVEGLDWAEEYVDRTVETLMESDSSGDTDGSSGEDTALLRVFLPLLVEDPPVPPEVPSEVLLSDGSIDTNAMVAAALWCNEVPLPADYSDELLVVAEAGGYELTHALGSLQFLVERECIEPDEAATLADELAGRTATLLEGDGLGDLELEACALLAWSGHDDLLPEDLDDRVEAAYLDEGGWPEIAGGGTPDPHATVWGLRCALELAHGDELPATTWIVSAS